MTKIQEEVENLRMAAAFVKWTFENTVNEVEDIIEVEKRVKHEAISKKVEAMLEDEKKIKKFISSHPGTQIEDFDYPLGILVQSGNQFVLNKINLHSDDKALNFETIYLNVLGKYKDMHVMASRTLLVNPQDD